MKENKVIRQISMFCLLLLLFLPLQSCVPTQAQSDLGARVSRLESEVSGLRSQLSQLQTRLSGVSRSATRPSSTPIPSVNRSVTSSDPMFDRLATLVIELKERINAVETRLTKLEEVSPPARKSS